MLLDRPSTTPGSGLHPHEQSVEAKRRKGGPVAILRDPVILAALVVNGAVALLTLFPVGDPELSYKLVESWALIPISILAAAAPWVGLPAMRGRRERLFWALWSTSLLVHLVVRILYVLVPDLDSIVSGSLAVDVLYVLFYLPLVLSVLVRPDLPDAEQTPRDVRSLEITGTVVFALFLLVYFVVIPRVYNQSEYESWVPSLLMYWVFDSFLLLTFFFLRDTTPSRDWRVLYTWLALAPACWAITEMLELAFYLDWEGQEWASSPADLLWYLPWLAITVAGRVRAHPRPGFLAYGFKSPDASEVSRSLGRPGWLLVAALALPIVHISASLVGALDPATRNLRELVVLGSLGILLGMAFVHQKILEARSLLLLRRGRASEAQQRLMAAAVEQSPDAILIADGDGIARYGNRAFEAMTGGSESAVGAPLLIALPSGLSRESREEAAAALKGGWHWEGRTSIEGPEGSARDELVTLSPVRSEAGEVLHWVLIRRDVTYLTRLERQVHQAERMEALESLAREIEDEFREVAGELYGLGDILRRGASGEEGLPRRDLTALLNSTERAAGLVGRIIEFSRREEERAGLHAVDSLVEEALELLRPSVPGNVELVTGIERGVGEVRGVRSHLHRIAQNLITNAIQAMEEKGGTLEVRLERVTLEGAEAEELGLRCPGPHALLRVRDTGRGMSPAIQARVFEPYFSTKEPGAGSGLGLYLVQGAVTALKGAIRVESVEGQGAIFEVYLPVQASKP